MHTSTNPFLNDTASIPSTKISPISPTKMYPANAYLNEKRSPSPTFVNITSPFDYPTPTKAHHPINHHPTSLKFAKTRDLISKSNQSSPIPIDQTELIFPDDAYRIEFCMPSNHVICKCPPTSADILFHHQQQQQQQQHHLQQQQHISQHQSHHQHHHSNTTKTRRKTKSKNEISNHQHRWRTKKCPEIPITNCQEIINIENYCAPTNSSQTTTSTAMLHHHSATIRNHHHPPPPVYDVYSYAYLEPPPPQPPTMQQQQFKSQKSSSPVTCLPATPSTSYAHQPPPLYDGRGPSTSSGSTSSSTSQHGKTPSRSSIKALLAKSFRSRANGFSSNSIIRSRSTSGTASNGVGGTNGVNCNGNGSNPLDKYTYTTRYGTTENLYEEVNEEKIREILSADGIDLQSPGGSPGHTVITSSPPPISSKEEQRRVQNNHFRILDELNLSLEALIMPTTPPDISPSEENNCNETGNGGLSGSKSVENISSTLKSLDLKSNKNNDVDSGYSVSSGSNITSLFYKENFKFGKKIMASAKRSATLSAKKSNMNQSKGYNEHPAIAMTLISPSSPFKSMKKFFDASQLQKTTIVDDESGSSGGGIGGVSGTKMKNKFWTIRQW